jgi:hypothetical protein
MSIRRGVLRDTGNAMSESKLRYPLWQEPLLQAVSETGPDLPEKIQIAEKAISMRLRDLNRNPGSEDERTALNDAVSTLRVLKSDKLEK